jgi:lipopolysaccharide export system protein LptA
MRKHWGERQRTDFGIERLEDRQMLDAAPVNDSYTLVEDQVLVADHRITAATTAANFTPLQQLSRFSYTDTVKGLKSSPQFLVTAVLNDTKITILDSTNGNVKSTRTPTNSFSDLDFSADGRYLFVADFGGGSAASYVHRYDAQTNTWQSKAVGTEIAYHIEAVDGQHFLLKEQNQQTDLTYFDFGATAGDATTLLAKRDWATYYGDLEYDYRTGKIFIASSGLSTTNAKTILLSGNTFVNGQDAPARTDSDKTYVLSDDGQYFFYGPAQYDANNLTAELRNYSSTVVASIGNLAFTRNTNTGIYNAITGVSLGTLGVPATYIADGDVAGKSLWIYNSTTKEIIQYNAPGANAGVLDNDVTVPAGSTLAIQTAPAHGTVNLNQDGTFKYTPAANYTGTDSFVYKITDPLNNITTATASFNILAVNDPPVAGLDSYQVDEDQTLTVTAALGLLANDIEYDGSALSITANTSTTKGTVTVAANGSFVYTPNANYNGADSFTYTLTDGTFSVTGTVAITVRPVADAPIAVDNSYSGNEDTTLTASSTRNVLTNDSDPDGATTLTAILVTPPAVGTLTLNSTGTFIYAPPANYNGSVSFTYRASDGALTSNLATVTIAVLPVNDAPTPAADAYQVDEDQVLTVSAANGVLLNDTDIDSVGLTVVGNTTPGKGTVVIAANGSLIYTPNTNFFGTDTFNYTVSDGDKTATGTVTVTVVGKPDAPVALDNSYSTNEDITLAVSTSRNVLTNDINVDATGTFTAILVSPPATGTLTLNAAGTYSFVPAANFNGNVTFTYQASDGTFLSNVATVTITVNPVNDAPTGAGDSYTLPWGAPTLTVTPALGLLLNDSDIDGDVLSAALVTAPANGTVNLNSDGSFTYTKGANFGITDTFTYRTRDPAGLFSSNQTVTINLDTGRIVIGATTLKANTPNQLVPIYITGNAPLNGFNFRIQLGDGLNGTAEPIFSNISYAGSIWAGSPTQTLGGPVSGGQMFVQSSIVFQDAQTSVNSTGLLATLVVDTTGIYGGTFALNLKSTQIGQDSDLIALGASSASPLFITNGSIIVTPAAVTTRQTFYNNSYFDGNNPAITAADLTTAVASDKTALRPSQAATFANYTSYSKGINGVVIEVDNIQYQPLLSEFEFRTGNTTTPNSWTLMTVAPTMTVESLGVGKVRIYFTWPDSTITKQWLQVLVKAKGPMGLPLDDVFYFGNAIGETGNQATNTFVDGTDFTYTRDNRHNFLNRATITDPADFNRDSLVDVSDLGFTRDNSTNFISALKLFTPPAHTTPNRTPYVPPSLTQGLVATPSNDSTISVSSQTATQYAATLASITTTTTATEAASVLVPASTPVAASSPSLSAVFAQLAASSTSASDDVSDDLFLTLRKKKISI